MNRRLELTQRVSFFNHCSNESSIKEFLKVHNENVFFMMQLSGMSYTDIQMMPVDKINKYIDWKLKWDADVQKAKEKAFEEMRSKAKVRSKR